MKYEDINWDDINVYQDIIQLPDEVWVDLSEFHGDIFEVSSYGRCRRRPYTSRKTERGYKILRVSDNGNGYKKFAITIKGKLKNIYVHRAVAHNFIPNPDNLPQVNHTRTGLGKHDNRAIHLEWVTNRDNILDAHDNGQMDQRTKVMTSIDVKDDDFIEAMYRRYKDTGKVGETAREFGVSRTTLSSIVNKRSRVRITNMVDLEYSS